MLLAGVGGFEQGDAVVDVFQQHPRLGAVSECHGLGSGLFRPDKGESAFQRLTERDPDRGGVDPCGVSSVISQHPVGMLIAGGHFVHEAGGLVVRAFGRGDEESEDQCRQRGDQAGAEMNSPSGVVGEMMGGEELLSEEAGGGGDEQDQEGDTRDFEGVHGGG